MKTSTASWRALCAGFLALLGTGLLAQQPTPIVRSPGNAQWATTPNEAMKEAAAQGKYVFYEFDRPGCGNCGRMDSLLYRAFDFEALLIPMVPVKVSLESPDGRELAKRYNIDDAPAILVTTPEGRLVFQMVGFLNTEDFYAHVRSDLDEYRKFARKIEAQDVPELPAREALETGSSLYQRSDSAAALPRLRRAVDAKDSTPEIRDSALELLAAAELDLHDVSASRATIDRLLQTTQDSLRHQRAELFRAQLPLSENKPDEALALFRKFLDDHPTSPYRKQVMDLLDKYSKSSRP